MYTSPICAIICDFTKQFSHISFEYKYFTSCWFAWPKEKFFHDFECVNDTKIVILKRIWFIWIKSFIKIFPMWKTIFASHWFTPDTGWRMTQPKCCVNKSSYAKMIPVCKLYQVWIFVGWRIISKQKWRDDKAKWKRLSRLRIFPLYSRHLQVTMQSTN